jgi:ADP-ribose pyrophosphatase YjhB (NUDIX family)
MSGSREYPSRPVVGVGAVVLDRGRVLLVRRGNEPLKGEWSLPGGAVEVGETLREAIRREVREETGLDVEPRAVVEVVDRISADRDGRTRFHYVLIDFVCDPVGGTLCCASDATEAVWIDKSAVAEYGVGEAAMSVIGKAFALQRADK